MSRRRRETAPWPSRPFLRVQLLLMETTWSAGSNSAWLHSIVTAGDDDEHQISWISDLRSRGELDDGIVADVMTGVPRFVLFVGGEHK